MYIVLAFIILSTYCMGQDRVLLNNVEKEFIVQKYIKIQADMDHLKAVHRSSQNDSLEYNTKVNVHFELMRRIGLNCFEFDSTGNYNSDVNIKKLNIEKLKNQNFDIYSGFIIRSTYFTYKYFIAIDDSGWVFPLDNFWIDNFQRFIKKKIGIIDNSDKALETMRIYVATKLYNIGGNGLIVDNGNLDSIKYWYPKLKSINTLNSIKCNKINNKDFNINTYIYFPFFGMLNYYQFYIKEDGDINYQVKTIYEE